jgi:hypothetical protein
MTSPDPSHDPTSAPTSVPSDRIYAVCLGGPCHGMLTRIDQHLGHVDLPVPDRDGQGAPAVPPARYHVTRERMHHPVLADPITVLRPHPDGDEVAATAT